MKYSFGSLPKFTFGFLTLVGIAAAMLATFGLQGSALNAAPTPQEARVACASNDMRRHSCPADTRGGVRLIKQRSEAKCILNQTWGYDAHGIWVDHGCRAEFDLGKSMEFNRENTYSVYCASDDMQRAWCPADARFGVQLIRQRSDSECLQNQTWGYGKRGIWVDRGCRADFQVAGDWQEHAAALLYCASDDMRRNFCEVDTLDGVFIVRQRSHADCVFNRTWGYDSDRIWVDAGCRADFEVVDYREAQWRDWDYRRDDRERDRYRDRDRDRDYRSDDRRDRDRDPYRDRDRDDRPPYDRDDRPPQP